MIRGLILEMKPGHQIAGLRAAPISDSPFIPPILNLLMTLLLPDDYGAELRQLHVLYCYRLAECNVTRLWMQARISPLDDNIASTPQGDSSVMSSPSRAFSRSRHIPYSPSYKLYQCRARSVEAGSCACVQLHNQQTYQG